MYSEDMKAISHVLPSNIGRLAPSDKTRALPDCLSFINTTFLGCFWMSTSRCVRQGVYNLAGIYGPQLDSLESILEDSNLQHYEKLVEPLPKRLTDEMLTSFDSRKEQIQSSVEEAILSRCGLVVALVPFVVLPT